MPTAEAPVPLYSRHEHGGHPVRVLPPPGGEGPTRYEVGWPTGPQTYPSARSLMRALYSGGDGSLCARDPGVSFRRYFRLGAPPVPVRGPWVELLGVAVPHRTIPPEPRRTPPRRGGSGKAGLTVVNRGGLRRRAKLVVEAPWWDRPVLVGGVSPLPVGSWARGGLTVVRPSSARPEPALTVEPVVLGIDLETRSHEVRKILYACFGARMARLGYDPQDVLQEVYRGLLARNRGTCPWDARKSSFGHYVHMVTECVLRNYTRKQRRIAKHEQVGVYAHTPEGQWGMVDAALVAQGAGEGARRVEEPAALGTAMSALEEYLMDSGRPEAVLAVLALPHVSAGCTRRMVAERVSDEIGETVAPQEMGKALAFLRRETRSWAAGQGLR